jgi:mono/diheme cytochrome c family protein
MHKPMLMVVLMSCALAFAADPKKDAGAKNPATTFALKGNAAKGEATFKLYCVTCHGEKGKGDGAASAALQPKPADFSDPVRAASRDDEFLYKVVLNGGQANGMSPMMTPWGPVLNDDQKVRDVVAYVRTFSKGAAASGGKDAGTATKATAKDAPKPAPKK